MNSEKIKNTEQEIANTSNNEETQTENSCKSAVFQELEEIWEEIKQISKIIITSLISTLLFLAIRTVVVWCCGNASIKWLGFEEEFWKPLSDAIQSFFTKENLYASIIFIVFSVVIPLYMKKKFLTLSKCIISNTLPAITSVLFSAAQLTFFIFIISLCVSKLYEVWLFVKFIISMLFLGIIAKRLESHINNNQQNEIFCFKNKWILSIYIILLIISFGLLYSL